MKALLVVAHPDKGSFNHAIGLTCARALTDSPAMRSWLTISTKSISIPYSERRVRARRCLAGRRSTAL